MAITYPLSLPTNVSPSSISLTAETLTSISVNPFTFQQQIHAYGGERWLADIRLPLMNRETAAEWIAFLTKLKGVQGTFYLGDSAAIAPLGVATGSPLADGVQSIGANTFDIKGFSLSTTDILKAGDYLQIGNRLHQNLNDVDSDGSGNVTIDIFPALRDAVADNDGIITASPKGLFRLSEQSQTTTSVNKDKIYSLAFKAVEAM